MRRWMALVVGGAVFVALAALLLTGRSEPTLSFLGDRKPIETYPGGWNGTSDYYSFKADYDTLLRDAREELEELGYWEPPTFSTDRIVFRAGTGWAWEADHERSEVEIWKDVRRRGETLASIEEKGWVTVLVQGPLPKPPPTFLDRIRGWLGL